MKLQRYPYVAMIEGDIWCNALDVERLENYCESLVREADAARKDASNVRGQMAGAQSLMAIAFDELKKENEELKSKDYNKRVKLAEIREQIRIANIGVCSLDASTPERTTEWLIQKERLASLFIEERKLMEGE